MYPHDSSLSAPIGARTLDLILIGRNEAHHLPVTLTAARVALEQLPRPEWRGEIYYVDSQSTDNSIETAERFGAIPICAHPDFRSASNGRTSGFLLSRGELVMFVDADCELHPDWLRHGIEFLENHPTAGAVAGMEEKIRSVGNHTLHLPNYDSVKNEIELVSPLIMTGTILARRTAVLAAGLQEPFAVSSTDRYMYFRMSRAGWPVYRIRQPMMRHHDEHLATPGQFRQKSLRMLTTAAGRGALLRQSLKQGVWRPMLASLQPEILHLGFLLLSSMGLLAWLALPSPWLAAALLCWFVLYTGRLMRRKHSPIFGLLALLTLSYYSLAILAGLLLNRPRLNWGIQMRPEYRIALEKANPHLAGAPSRGD